MPPRSSRSVDGEHQALRPVRAAGLLRRPRSPALKHIEFVHLAPGRALVVLVTEGGMVENRLIDVPLGLPMSTLVEATNYLSARLVGRTIGMAREGILAELMTHRAELDSLTRKVVEAGLATWSDADRGEGALIVRGQSHLLDDVQEAGDLERLRSLFTALETKEQLLKLLEAADQAEGVQIFIGAESNLFVLPEPAVISPYRDSQRQLVGAVGVIGPSRLNYARIIPMVDYTAKVIGRILG